MRILTMAVIGLLVASTAQAESISFSGYADANDLALAEDGNNDNKSDITNQNDNERAFAFGDVITIGSQDVKLMAWTTDSGTSPFPLNGDYGNTAPITAGPDEIPGSGSYAYLDSGNAGLGVTHGVGSNLQANPSSDDNTGATSSGLGEVVGFQIMGASSIDGLKFRNSEHHENFGNDEEISYSTDLGFTWTLTTINAINGAVYFETDTLLLAYAGDTPASQVGSDNHLKEYFYVDSVEYSIVEGTIPSVPEPGSLAAFGIGACCMGFVFGRRRRDA